MYDTHTPAEWAEMASLAVGIYAAASAPYFLLVDAEVWAWQRPLTAVLDHSKPVVRLAADRALVEAVNARLFLRDAALSLAALLMLATINPGDAR